MSTYCNISDIKLRIDTTTYNRLTGEGNTANDTLCQSVIDSIDLYARELLSKSYADTTLLEGSIVLKNICVELVVCSLMNRRQANAILMGAGQDVRCKQASDSLYSIASGAKTIIVDGVEVETTKKPLGLKVTTKTIEDSETPPYWY